MIEPFRLHESRDSARAQNMQKEQPWKITDEELSSFEEKVEPSSWHLLTFYLLFVRAYQVSS